MSANGSNNVDDLDDRSFDGMGACTACNADGLCEEVVCHLGNNIFGMRHQFDTTLSGRDFIDNVMETLQSNTEHQRLREQDLSHCVPVWRNGIERNNFGNNDGYNNNGDDDDDDDGNQSRGPYELDGGFSGSVLPGVNDSFEEHRLGADREDENLVTSLLEEARRQVMEEGAGGVTNSAFTAGVNDRLRAIEGARSICKRELYYENSTSAIIKQRINAYLQRELPHVHFSNETADLLYSLWHDPDNADAAIEALDDEDLKVAYRIFKTQGEDENEYGQQQTDDNEDSDGDDSEYEYRGDSDNFEVAIDELAELGLFDETEEEGGNDPPQEGGNDPPQEGGNDPPQDTSGTRRSRSNDDDDEGGGNTRQRRR
eukprot:scaffold95_cov116-Skeletonema_menzelii.AAC.1